VSRPITEFEPLFVKLIPSLYRPEIAYIKNLTQISVLTQYINDNDIVDSVKEELRQHEDKFFLSTENPCTNDDIYLHGYRLSGCMHAVHIYSYVLYIII